MKPTDLKLKLRMNNIFLEPHALFISDNPSHFLLAGQFNQYCSRESLQANFGRKEIERTLIFYLLYV